AFELASYWPDSLAQVGAVMLSHGGTRRFAREALARMKASGGTAVVITGKGPEAPAEADWTLRTVGQEVSGGHTGRYTAALAILAKLAAAATAMSRSAAASTGSPTCWRSCSVRNPGTTWPRATAIGAATGSWAAGRTRRRPWRLRSR